MKDEERIEYFNNLIKSQNKFDISVHDFYLLTRNIKNVDDQQFDYMIDYYKYKQSIRDNDSLIIFSNLEKIETKNLKKLLNLESFSIQFLSPKMLNNITKRLLLYDPLLDEIGKMRFLNEQLAYSESKPSEIIRKNLLKKTKKSYYLIYNSIYNQIEICEGTTHIESHLFDGYDIEKVFIPSSVVEIQDNAFYQCKNLTTVSLKCMNLKSIGKSAFSDCENLKSFIMPDNVNVIEDYTFKGCKKLENIKLPNTLEVIKEKAFAGCDSLTEVILPKTIKKIGFGAFKKCKNLKIFVIPGVIYIHPSYNNNDDDDEKYEEASVQNFIIPAKCFAKCREFETVIIKQKCQIIEDSAFYLCSKLTEINFELSKGTKIGNSSFKECDQLKQIEFIVKRNVSLEIGQSSFEECKALKKIAFDHPELFDKNQLKVKSFAFKGCINLKQFIFPDNCDGDIGTNCFENCIDIEFVSLPSNITTISKEMFKNCSNLKSINLCEKEITFIDDGAFDNCEKLCLKSLPVNLRKIGDNAFRKCSLLEIKNLPPGIEEIGEKAFNECIRLIELTIPASMKVIHKEAFKECSQLEKVKNESQQVVIEKKAFFKCQKLKEVFTESKTGFSSEAFKDCAKGLDFFRIENEL